MNKTRAIVNLSAIRGFNQKESMIFSIFFGQKGRYYTNEKLMDKLGANLMGEIAEGEGEAEKAEKAAKTLITKTINKLVEANIVMAKVDQPKGEAVEYKMPEYDIKDLNVEQQLLIGGKAHTTLTANGTTVHYNGDVLLYMCHPLSPEYKAGQRIGTGTLKDFHINEEGFKYGIITKPVMVEGEKAKTCAVKLSQAELLERAIPEGAKEVVKYKSKASITKPELTALGDLSKGTHLILFNAAWSPQGLQMGQIVEGLLKTPMAEKFTAHQINTDHQVAECKQFNIRTAPTLIMVVDGTEVSRMENLPNSEDVNKDIYTFIKKVAEPTAAAPKAKGGKGKAKEEEAK